MNKPQLFRQLHHVCLVVNDIDKSVAYYESVGIGPWLDYPPLDQYTDLDVPHRDGFMAMKYKFVDIDNMQLQLCEPSQDPSPQRLHLDEKGEGVFHLGFVVPDCDVAEAEGKEHGLDVFMRGRRPEGSGFTYFDTADKAGVVLEVRASAIEK